MVKSQLGRRLHLSGRTMPARTESGAHLCRGKNVKWNKSSPVIRGASEVKSRYCLIEWEAQTQLLHFYPVSGKVFLSLSADLPPRQMLAHSLTGPGSIRHWQQHLPLALATTSNYRSHQEPLMYPRKSCSSRNVIPANTFTFQGLWVLSN